MDTKAINSIIHMFEESKLAKMELEVDDIKIKMEKEHTGALAPLQEITLPLQPSIANNSTSTIPQEVPQPQEEEKSGVWVKAPIVGTFYISAGNGSIPYITIGQRVHKGDVLCIIEAMKVMNEIHAPVDGIIQEILVTNDAMVEYDQDLIRIGEAHD